MHMSLLHTNDIKLQLHPNANQQLQLACLMHPTHIVAGNSQQTFAGLLALLLIPCMAVLLSRHGCVI
jgi:hypothetical protein